jgi:hypothetical protein
VSTGADIEDLLRRLAPRVLAALVRYYGNFELAEDAVQEALLAAALQWPARGVPDSPEGWLVTVASRRMTDQLRSEKVEMERSTIDGAAVSPNPRPRSISSLRRRSGMDASACCAQAPSELIVTSVGDASAARRGGASDGWSKVWPGALVILNNAPPRRVLPAMAFRAGVGSSRVLKNPSTSSGRSFDKLRMSGTFKDPLMVSLSNHHAEPVEVERESVFSTLLESHRGAIAARVSAPGQDSALSIDADAVTASNCPRPLRQYAHVVPA